MSADTLLLNLMLRALPERRDLGGVVLATYRVELTALLNRMASSGFEEGDLDHVDDLARRIAATAMTVELPSVHGGAILLRERAAAAQGRRALEEGAVLLAGLRVIDDILSTVPEPTRRAIGASLN